MRISFVNSRQISMKSLKTENPQETSPIVFQELFSAPKPVISHGDAAKQELFDLLHVALQGDLFDGREKEIIASRFFYTGRKPVSLQAIGEIFGVTRETIRRNEAKIVWKLKNYFKLNGVKPELLKLR